MEAMGLRLGALWEEAPLKKSSFGPGKLPRGSSQFEGSAGDAPVHEAVFRTIGGALAWSSAATELSDARALGRAGPVNHGAGHAPWFARRQLIFSSPRTDEVAVTRLSDQYARPALSTVGEDIHTFL